MPKIVINGKNLSFREGETILEIAWKNGIYIPVLCYHPHLPVFSGCRICLVEVNFKGKRALLPSCSTEAQEGMEIFTDTEEVKREVRRSVLEFLLLNHPLECPVCDCGGECDFQNLVYLMGPESSRYEFQKDKRVKKKALPFLELYPNRCILCSRCVSFYREISSDGDWGLYERGPFSYVGPVRDKVLESEFSGNMIEICPLGAITGVDYRFKGRPWEIEKVPSISPHDSIGASIYVHVRRGGSYGRGPFKGGGFRGEWHQILRITTRPSIGVNYPWIDDRTRFIHQFINSGDRILSPMIKREGRLEEVSWEEAFLEVKILLEKTMGDYGSDSIALIAGGIGSNESAYLMSKLLRDYIGSPHLFTGSPFVSKDPLFEVLGVSAGNGKIEGIEKADVIFVFHNSIRGSAPILSIPLIRAKKRGIPIFLFSPFLDYGESRWAGEQIHLIPPSDMYLLFSLLKRIAEKSGHKIGGGDGVGSIDRMEMDESRLEKLSDSFLNASNPLIILSEDFGYKRGKMVLSLLFFNKNSKVLYIRETPNGQGFVDMGIHPELTSGQRVSPKPGLGPLEIFRKIEEGKIKGLFLWNVDPVLEYPGGDSIIQTFKSLEFLIVFDSFITESVKCAHIVLPVALPFEEEGSFTNTEGRVQFAERALNPPPLVLPTNKVIAEIIKILSGDEFPDGALEIFELIRENVPLYREIHYGGGETVEYNYPSFLPSLNCFSKAVKFPLLDYPLRRKRVSLEIPSEEEGGDFVLLGVRHLYKNRYSVRDESLRGIVPEFEMSYRDAEKLGIEEGDEVQLISRGKRIITRVKLNRNLQPGITRVWGPVYYPYNNLMGEEGFAPVKIERVK
jgi:NADH dehydrogenase/NADH:ubiquinone oxidoreductase subunit G